MPYSISLDWSTVIGTCMVYIVIQIHISVYSIKFVPLCSALLCCAYIITTQWIQMVTLNIIQIAFTEFDWPSTSGKTLKDKEYA